MATPKSTRMTKPKLVEALQTEEAVSESRALVITDLSERIAEIEFGLEDSGWTRLSGETDKDLSRDGLRGIVRLTRMYWLKNPLIRRPVHVIANYVFGQGMSVGSRNEDVNEVIQAFWEDPSNKKVLTGHSARTEADQQLQIEANLFFVFFSDPDTGRVQIRMVPFDEINDIKKDPNDRTRPLYYHRKWMSETTTDSGSVSHKQNQLMYPDIDLDPGEVVDSFGGIPVAETPILHVKVGALPDMKYGVPQVWAAIDWAKAYNQFLTDWAAVSRAHARYAWQVAVGGGRTGIVNAKAQLESTVSLSNPKEDNPPGEAGGTFLSGVGEKGAKLDALRTAGAQTGPEAARRLMLMVASAVGLPETYFGDVSIGNHATAQTMERPVELMMRDRQELWREIFQRILKFVIIHNVTKMGESKIPEAEIDVERGYIRIMITETPEAPPPGPDGKERDAPEPITMEVDVDINFPPILEHAPKDKMEAITKAASIPRVITPMELARQVLTVLEVEHIDEELARLFPDGDDDILAIQMDPSRMMGPILGDEDEDEDEDDDSFDEAATRNTLIRSLVRVVESVNALAGVDVVGLPEGGNGS